MLVLTRKPGERIHIGPDIIVTLLEINGNKVRLGIDAPDNVTILRAELRDFVGIAAPECRDALTATSQ